MVNPPETDARVLARKGTLPAGLLRSGHFWSLVVAFFAGTVAGLSIVGSLEKIGKTLGAPDEWVKVSVMVLAVGNASGRAGWGILVELLGARTAVSVSLALQAVFIVTLILAGHAGPAFVVLAFLIGFNYGGNFVLYVTEVAHKYGPDRVGSVYGIIYVIYVVSGICGPSMAGASFDHWKTYVPSMTVAAAATLAGAGAFLILYRKPVENAL
jgi:OFA family oxalate/formate antiporter-like MFS transporter